MDEIIQAFVKACELIDKMAVTGINQDYAHLAKEELRKGYRIAKEINDGRQDDKQPNRSNRNI